MTQITWIRVFGEGEAQTPPPQHPRSPEGGGVVHAAQPEECLPGLRTGPATATNRGAPEKEKNERSHGEGGSMYMNSPQFPGSSPLPSLANLEEDEEVQEEINNSEDEEINQDVQEEEEEEEARLEQEEEALFPFHQEIFDWDWGAEYQKCPKFVEIWRRCHTPNAEWPDGLKFFKDKLDPF